LLLDLDETLIHADFDEEFSPDEYDTIIKFRAKPEIEEEGREKNIEDSDSTSCCLSEVEDDEIHSVGIFIRNGVKHFLKEVNKYFEVGIFTASVKEYADAVIAFLDPENKLIKFRLYRSNCINFNDAFTVKDLRIFKNVNLKNIVLLDNSMYSFASQINNGILINTFINDKSDNELYNALEYLVKYIYPAEDVRDVNERFFNFLKIMNDIIN
jgi:CTD small phosphatase-like protein 2